VNLTFSDQPADGDRLMALLRAWDAHREQRSEIDEQIREHLRNLREDLVPPLRNAT
jgi:hypothetical protein